MSKKFKFTFILFMLVSTTLSFAGVNLNQLKKIQSISTKNEPKVFGLLFSSSKKLSESWDQDLAHEIARVYKIVISYNQNSYVVELINPAVQKWQKKFETILFTHLDKKQRKLYRDTMKRHKKEIKEGNG